MSGAFLYEGDAPLAERKVQALAVDSQLLAELLGHAELRELLDPQVVAETERELQRLVPERQPRGLDDAHDLFRTLGALSQAEAQQRGVSPVWLAELTQASRIVPVSVNGDRRFIAVEDAARYRDGLGVALSAPVPAVFAEPVRDPLGDVIARYARTHGPFTAEECAQRFGLSKSTVEQTLRRLESSNVVVSGEFRAAGAGEEWCGVETLRTVRRRSLAALRRDVEPVEARALAAFLPAWHGIGVDGPRRGKDALVSAVEQLQGVALPASAWESLVLPSRVSDYEPGWLDELIAAGEIRWCGAGSLPGGDGWLALAFAESSRELFPPTRPITLTPLHQSLLDGLADGKALFFRDLVEVVEEHDQAAVAGALWDLVWAGYVTNDTLGPVRASLGSPVMGRIVRRGARRLRHPTRFCVTHEPHLPTCPLWPEDGGDCRIGIRPMTTQPSRLPSSMRKRKRCWSDAVWSPEKPRSLLASGEGSPAYIRCCPPPMKPAGYGAAILSKAWAGRSSRGPELWRNCAPLLDG